VGIFQGRNKGGIQIIEVPEEKREYCPKCAAYFYPVINGKCYFCKTKTIKGYKEKEREKK